MAAILHVKHDEGYGRENKVIQAYKILDMLNFSNLNLPLGVESSNFNVKLNSRCFIDIANFED